MPGDCFTFAVFICCQEDFVSPLESRLQLGNRLRLTGANRVVRLEVVFDVDRELSEWALFELFWQIARLNELANVTNRGKDGVVVAQVLRDRLSLCRRLNDYEFVSQMVLLKDFCYLTRRKNIIG